MQKYEKLFNKPIPKYVLYDIFSDLPALTAVYITKLSPGLRSQRDNLEFQSVSYQGLNLEGESEILIYA